MRSAKTWATDLFYRGEQRRAIVHTSTKRAAAEAFGFSLHYFYAYAWETGNAQEIAQAASKPGVVFVHVADVSAAFDDGEWIAQ